MPGMSIGFWSPHAEIGDVEAFSERIREICGPTSVGFPFAVAPVRENGMTVLSYAVLRGHVPIHIDKPNPAEHCSQMFTFVVEAENRPVLLYAPAGQRETETILLPEKKKVSTMGFGAVELIPGRALHFDLARAWHGITGFPTGDVVADLPEATLIQVPYPQAQNIMAAMEILRRVVLADERFADLTARRNQSQTGGEDEIGGPDSQPG